MSLLEKLTSAPEGVEDAALQREIAWRRLLPNASPGVLMLALGLLRCTRSVLSWDEIATADAALSLRLPSILAMAAAAALTGELSRRLLGPAATGMLLCLVPNIFRYAAEARPYAWVCLPAVLALVLLYRALERLGAGRWVAYAAAIVGAGLGSLVALTTLAGRAVLLITWLLREPSLRRSIVLPWLRAVAGTLVALSPLIWWALRLAAAVDAALTGEARP